jgi:hypothetical protein
MDNPYTGTEWEQSWQQGHDAGLSQPTGTVNTPAVLEQNQAQIFNEGVLAGQTEAAQSGTPVQVNPVKEPEKEGFPTELTATTVFAIAGWAVEGLAKGWFGAAVHILISVSIPSGDPRQDLSDPAELSPALTAAVKSMGADDLYVAFCRNANHSAVGDQITTEGYWHSNVFTDYWAAYPVAVEHLSSEPDSTGEVGLVHVKANSDGIEWIELA